MPVDLSKLQLNVLELVCVLNASDSPQQSKARGQKRGAEALAVNR